jgi:hypothetical protein
MSTEMWISECENICNFLSHKKDLLNYFYENIEKENLILEKMKDYNTYLDENSLLLGIRLSLNEIKRVQLSLTTNRF